MQNSQSLEEAHTAVTRRLVPLVDGSEPSTESVSNFNSPASAKLVSSELADEAVVQVTVAENQIDDGPYGYQPEEGAERQIVVYPTGLICGGAPDLDCGINSSFSSNELYEITETRCIAPCEDQWDSEEPPLVIQLATDPLADFHLEDLPRGTTKSVMIQYPVYQDYR